MTSVPGVDHPEEQTEAEITLIGRGISVSARVEVVHEGFIAVRPSAGDYVDQVVVKPGDAVEVFWKTEDSQRALPAVVTEVEQAAIIRWRMEITGPAEPSQRRKAVRGRVYVPITAECDTIDLSEAGLRAEFDGFGAPPEAGARMVVTASFEDGVLKSQAEVMRTQARGARWIISVRFVNMEEKDQDR